MSNTNSVRVVHVGKDGDGKLGIKLDKEAPTPTILQITAGSQASAAGLQPGWQVLAVGDDNIEGVTYEQAKECVQRHTERPLLLRLRTHCSHAIKHTSSEVEKMAQQATAEGLRNIRNALLCQPPLGDSDSGDESDTSSRRVRTLEQRIHYLRQDLNNAQVDLNSEKTAHHAAKLQLTRLHDVGQCINSIDVAADALFSNGSEESLYSSWSSQKILKKVEAWKASTEEHLQRAHLAMELLAQPQEGIPCLGGAPRVLKQALVDQRSKMGKLELRARRWIVVARVLSAFSTFGVFVTVLVCSCVIGRVIGLIPVGVTSSLPWMYEEF